MVETMDEANEPKRYLHGLPFPIGAFRRFRPPSELAAVIEESDGRMLVSPPPDMESNAAFRWRTAQRELQELVEQWEPQPVNPPISEPKPRREDRDSLREMLAARPHYEAELAVNAYELATLRLEAELVRLLDELRLGQLYRKRAELESRVWMASNAELWLIADAPPELQSELEAAEKQLADSKKIASPAVGDHPMADYLGEYHEKVRRAQWTIQNSDAIPYGGREQALSDARHDLERYSPQVERMERARDEATSRIAEVRRRMLEA